MTEPITIQETQRLQSRKRQMPSRRTHGGRHLPEYGIWDGIKKRCYNKKARNYERYGGRGIRVCERWLHSFTNFYADMGARPSQAHQIERNDNGGNYCPENCRWATRSEQARNRRSSVLITVNEQTLTLLDWCERLGTTTDAIRSRVIRNGSSYEEEICTILRTGKAVRALKLPADVAMAVKSALALGESQRSIAKRFRIARSTVHCIATGKRHAD